VSGAAVTCQEPIAITTGTAATVTANLDMVGRVVSPDLLGVHTSAYDGNMQLATTPDLLKAAGIGRFKPACDFDWSWPKRCDRAALEALMALDFLREATNVVLLGPNGVGKTLWAQNLAHQAVLQGATVLFTTAGHLLGELAALDSDSALRRKLRHYAAPDLLVIDEVGYLSYGTRHADLLFELVSRRYQTKSTLVTTNRPFAEWGEVFPSAACVVSLVDRLLHNAEVIAIEAASYRLKEAKERTEQRARRRRKNIGDTP